MPIYQRVILSQGMEHGIKCVTVNLLYEIIVEILIGVTYDVFLLRRRSRIIC